MSHLKKPLTFVGWGLGLWLLFVIIIRLLGTIIFTTGTPLLAVLFVATVPIVIGTVKLISIVTHVPMQQMLLPIVIIDATALFIDGIAVGFTNIYGPTPDQIAAAASFLLWGVSITLIYGIYLERKTA